MKDTFYFQHDYNASTDEKIVDLRLEYGWEGYGIYWALIEMLAQNGGYLRFNCKRIAFALQVNCTLVSDVLKNYGLFDFEGDFVYSPRLLEQLNYREQLKEKRKKAAEKRWHGGEQDANALQMEYKSNAGEMQDYAKERKGKERKGNPSGGSGDSNLSDIELGQFKEIWLDYLQHRREIGVKKYKSEKSERLAFQKLLELSGKDLQKAQEIVNQSRANSWTGLFELKKPEKNSEKPAMYANEYMGYPVEERRKMEHPVLLRGQQGEIQVAVQPGRQPISYKKYQNQTTKTTT